MGLEYLAMVTSPTGKGVIAMGGISSGRASKAMFELSQSMEWTRLEQTLQIEHFAPLAIPIPDELVYDKIKEKNNYKISPPMLDEPISYFSPLSTSLYFLMGGIFLYIFGFTNVVLYTINCLIWYCFFS